MCPAHTSFCQSELTNQWKLEYCPKTQKHAQQCQMQLHVPTTSPDAHQVTEGHCRTLLETTQILWTQETHIYTENGKERLCWWNIQKHGTSSSTLQMPSVWCSHSNKKTGGKVKDFSKAPLRTSFYLDFYIFQCHIIARFLISISVSRRNLQKFVFFSNKVKESTFSSMHIVLSWLKKGGINVQKLQWGENGGLARSGEFGKLLFKETNIVVQTTGSYLSTIYGKAERPHLSIKNMIRTSLMGSNSPNFRQMVVFMWTVFFDHSQQHAK